MPALTQRALRDDNSHPRWRSLWALASIDLDAAEAIPEFISALQDPDPTVVRNAAVALAFFANPEGMSELLSALQDPDEFRRWEAVFSLREIGDAGTVEALVPLLDQRVEPATRVRSETALVLGRLGGGEAITALLEALQQDADPQVRWRAALALSRVGDASILETLEQGLVAEEDPQVIESLESAISELQKRQ